MFAVRIWSSSLAFPKSHNGKRNEKYLGLSQLQLKNLKPSTKVRCSSTIQFVETKRKPQKQEQQIIFFNSSAKSSSFQRLSSFLLQSRSFSNTKLVRAGVASGAEHKITHQAKATQDIMQTEYYHWAAVSLAVLTPVTILLSPSALNIPIDVALAFVIPFHTHLGMTLVIHDYIPNKSIQSGSMLLLWLITILTALGLLKLSINGPGLTETIKRLWRPKKEKAKK